MFPYRYIYKSTWRSPDEWYINQIDYVVIISRFANTVLDVRTADCDKDHMLGIIKVNVTLKKTHDTWKIKAKGQCDV